MSRPSGYARNKNDWYVEPVWATTALLERIQIHRGLSVWDPACGGGNIVRASRAAGYWTSGSDIENRGGGVVGDFLGHNLIFSADWIISNPPYGLALPFIEKALTIARVGVAMLLRLEFLEGQKRMAFFEKHPPAEVLIFGPRVSMPPGELLQSGDVKASGGTTAYCWIVWRIGHRDAPRIGWLGKPAADPYADGWEHAAENSAGCYDAAITAIRERQS